jgi:hypothetical protein
MRNRRPPDSTSSIPASLAPASLLTKAKLAGAADRWLRPVDGRRARDSRRCHQWN